MDDRDYYEILGVSRTASADEIRKAYRDLARRYHPDVSKEPNAQERFTEIQEAYDILSDDTKRARYDQVGRAGVAGQAPGGGWRTGGGHVDFDVDDLGSMFDAFFTSRGGGRAQAHRPRQRSGPRASQPIKHTLMVSFLTMARGGKQDLELSDGSATKTVQVTIPRGVADGATLRLSGAGPGGRTVLVTIRVGGHPHFRRPDPGGLDLEFDLPITCGESALGATISVPTLDGAVDMRVPAGTACGQKLRLRGKGLADQSDTRGDLYAIAKIVPPEQASLTDEERQALKQLDARRASPRQGPAWEPGWTP